MDYLVITECHDFLKFKEKIKIFFINYWQICIIYKIQLAYYQIFQMVQIRQYVIVCNIMENM